MNKKPTTDKQKKKGFVVFLIGLLILIALGFYEMYFRYMLKIETVDTGETIEVQISQGESLKTVAKTLKENNLINSEFIFLTYMQREDLDTKIHAGQQYVSTGLTIPDVVNLLLSSEDKQKTIKILEGWSNKDVAEYIEGQGVTKESFVECLENCIFSNDFITDKVKNGRYEGFLFPDTYKISANPTPKEIIGKMLDNFERKMTVINKSDIEASDELVAFIESYEQYDFIIIASLIEREVRTDEDRKIVSGIIWKRLKQNMGLGIDATVLYVLGDWNATLTYKNLQVDSPYNTRKYAGLPPTPIAQPSLASIKAAYNPIEKEYLYYLTADSGEMIYSKTLTEHNRNKRTYIKQ